MRDFVLVTGGNGFVGAHTIVRLLRDGHHVRTTVRSPEREPEVLEALESAEVDPGGRLEIVLAGLDSDEGWDAAMAGCPYVLHVASPFPAHQPENEDDVIIPAREGTLRALRAARDAGVRRVVLTSSFAAVGYSPKPGGVYDENDWTDPADDNAPYIRSKPIAERAAWDFVAEQGRGMELTVINPSGIFGPQLGTRVSASPGIVKTMLEGGMSVTAPLYFPIVDVREVADLHVRAMTHPGAAGQRFLAGSTQPMSFLLMARILAEHLGERASRVPTRELTAEEVRQNPEQREAAGRLGEYPVLNTRKARTMLDWKPRDPETTIVDTAESLYRLGLIDDAPATR